TKANATTAPSISPFCVCVAPSKTIPKTRAGFKLSGALATDSLLTHDKTFAVAALLAAADDPLHSWHCDSRAARQLHSRQLYQGTFPGRYRCQLPVYHHPYATLS